MSQKLLNREFANFSTKFRQLSEVMISSLTFSCILSTFVKVSLRIKNDLLLNIPEYVVVYTFIINIYRLRYVYAAKLHANLARLFLAYWVRRCEIIKDNQEMSTCISSNTKYSKRTLPSKTITQRTIPLCLSVQEVKKSLDEMIFLHTNNCFTPLFLNSLKLAI